MVVVPLGKPSRGPIHPDYVPSIFSFQKSTDSVPSTRYLRAVRRSRTRSALLSKCCKQPSTEVIDEKAEGDDAIDFTETAQGENENEAVASCSVSTEPVDEIMDGVISRDLAGTQVVDEEITQLNKNTVTMDEDSIEESTEDAERTVQVENSLDEVESSLDEAEENELTGDLNLREIEEQFPQGMSSDVDEMRCDELDESSLQNTVRVLVHELERKEIEVGELQIENDRD